MKKQLKVELIEEPDVKGIGLQNMETHINSALKNIGYENIKDIKYYGKNAQGIYGAMIIYTEDDTKTLNE